MRRPGRVSGSRRPAAPRWPTRGPPAPSLSTLNGCRAEDGWGCPARPYGTPSRSWSGRAAAYRPYGTRRRVPTPHHRYDYFIGDDCVRPGPSRRAGIAHEGPGPGAGSESAPGPTRMSLRAQAHADGPGPAHGLSRACRHEPRLRGLGVRVDARDSGPTSRAAPWQ